MRRASVVGTGASWRSGDDPVYPGGLPRFARLVDARGLRAPAVAVTALLVALVAGTVAVALGTADRAVATAPMVSEVHDGLTAEQELAAALAERAAPVVASRAVAAPRPT